MFNFPLRLGMAQATVNLFICIRSHSFLTAFFNCPPWSLWITRDAPFSMLHIDPLEFIDNDPARFPLLKREAKQKSNVYHSKCVSVKMTILHNSSFTARIHQIYLVSRLNISSSNWFQSCLIHKLGISTIVTFVSI